MNRNITEENIMKKSYKNIDDFLEDLEDESLKEFTLDTGVFKKSDFRGPQFVSCIFHSGDHTPSLQITDKFFKCYSCGAKGSFVNFVMLNKSLSFFEAVKLIGDHFGSKIENMKSINTEKRSNIQRQWDQYLYDMSRAPREIQELKREYFPIDVGYDKDINYIVLPYTSKANQVLGFTKRVIGPTSDFRPKWKHSSGKEGLQEEIHNIFNLGNAIGEIGRTKQIIVTEGPKDVIAYLRQGINNVICVSGTSNATNIWDEFPVLDEIVLSFDNDKAGHHATIQSVIDLSKRYDFDKIKIVMLPEGQDPYDIDGNLLKELYDQRVSALDFVIEHSDPTDFNTLYNTTMMHNKFKVMAAGSRIKNMNHNELESWMRSEEKQIRRPKQDPEKERLLKIVNGEVQATQDEVYKATRILQLKYKIKL